MPEIHLICGFIGFGKTTYAKKLECELPAIRFTHDEIMVQRYGRHPDDFKLKYQIVDNFIKEETIKLINNGQNVILDYGFWSREVRKEYYNWAKSITNKVYFHSVICDIETAKKRVLKRNIDDTNELFIDENCFDNLLDQYEPISETEKYKIIFYNNT